jgi:hypothetical protein
MWDVNKLLVKYPIKNIWEWKFTGNVITSIVCLHDIKHDPWNRNFTETKKTFTVDEMGLLVHGYTKVDGKKIRLWSCV